MSFQVEINNVINIVSGLPRSGTSMMMKMLEAGGMEILTDYLRPADENNPKGYFEYERVKKLKEGDQAWLEEANGKVIKIISALLEHMPANYSYKVIFMRRNMGEILASQKHMLISKGKDPGNISDGNLAILYQNHLDKVQSWLEKQANFDVLYVHYNEILKRPMSNIERVNNFLGGNLDSQIMLEIIDNNLYRQRFEVI